MGVARSGCPAAAALTSLRRIPAMKRSPAIGNLRVRPVVVDPCPDLVAAPLRLESDGQAGLLVDEREPRAWLRTARRRPPFSPAPSSRVRLPPACRIPLAKGGKNH